LIHSDGTYVALDEEVRTTYIYFRRILRNAHYHYDSCCGRRIGLGVGYYMLVRWAVQKVARKLK
jgi:hypothetical protein